MDDRPGRRPPGPAGTLAGVEGLNSDLDLNGAVSARVKPRVGDWAPADVPSTRRKRWQRWLVLLVCVLVLAAVLGFGAFAWMTLRGY